MWKYVYGDDDITNLFLNFNEAGDSGPSTCDITGIIICIDSFQLELELQSEVRSKKVVNT
jgi:hypothetical protein